MQKKKDHHSSNILIVCTRLETVIGFEGDWVSADLKCACGNDLHWKIKGSKREKMKEQEKMNVFHQAYGRGIWDRSG